LYDKAERGELPNRNDDKRNDLAVYFQLPNRNYEKENDLAVYVQCVERLGQLASIMNVYPKTMTLEQVKESIEYQLEKYRKLVIGQ